MVNTIFPSDPDYQSVLSGNKIPLYLKMTTNGVLLNEQKMYDTIYESCKGKTLIIISHRLSCEKDADCIYVMEKDKIIEEGSHKELMELDKKYAKMFTLQGKRYGVKDNIIVDINMYCSLLSIYNIMRKYMRN